MRITVNPPDPEPGTVRVNSNIPTSWSINGAASYSGSGYNATYGNAPLGNYSIYNVPGQISHSGSNYTLNSINPDSSQTLTSGGEITFTINYVAQGGGPGPGGNTGTIRVNTNRSNASFSVWRGSGGQNLYDTGTGTSATFNNVPAPDTYQVTAETIGGVVPTVTPSYSTLTPGSTRTFNVVYGGCAAPCTPPPPPPQQGTMTVNATLDGAPINTSFIVNYTYNGGATGINPYGPVQIPVTTPFGPTPAYVGQHTGAYASGGPVGAIFQDVTGGVTKTVNAGQNTTWTFNFTSGTPVGYGIQYDVVYNLLPLNTPSLSLDNSTCEQIALNWTYTNNTREQYFTVWRTTNPTLGWDQLNGNFDVDERSYTDTTGTPGTSYYYRVMAHSAIGVAIPITEESVAGPINYVPCVADFVIEYDILQVNGQPYNTGIRIADGDQLRFNIFIRNLGPEDATVNYVCLNNTSNLVNLSNLTATSGTNGGIGGAGGNCATARLNVSGAQAANTNRIFTFDTTIGAASDNAQELITSTATLWFTDSEGLKSRSATRGAVLLFQTDNPRVPDFREVGP